MINILVIDIGTTSIKGIVYDEKANVLTEHKVFSSLLVLNSIEVEQNPVTWKEAVHEIIREIQNKNIIYDAITLTAQRSSVFPIDRSGKPLYNAIMWQDRRTESICSGLKDYEDVIYEKTGLLIRPIYGASKILWFKKNYPELYKKAYKFVVIADYVLYLITGNLVTDYTYGNRSLLMNMKTCEWDTELLNIFDIDKSKLCTLIRQGSLVGYTTKELSDVTGIKQGIPVYTSGGDQQCAALGLGVIEKGSAEITHGTGSYLMVHSENPVVDKGKFISCNVSAIPGTYLLESSFMTTGVAYDWFNHNFYSSEEKIDYSFVNKEVKESGVGARGIVMLPHFQGTGTPDWNTKAKGIFFNISLDAKRGDFARAILEGIAIEISKSLTYIEDTYGFINKLSISGGLSSLDTFNQIQADVYKKDVIKPGYQEATALGAWISCLVSMGCCKEYKEVFEKVSEKNNNKIFKQKVDNSEVYDNLKLKEEELYQTLKKSGIYSKFMK